MTARTPPPSWHPASLLPPSRDAADRPVLWAALAAAGLLHLGALCLPLPPARQAEVPALPQIPTLTVRETPIPPPSTPEPDRPPPRDFVRRIPVPAPETGDLDPVREPAPAPVSEVDAPPVWVEAQPAPPAAPPAPVDEWTPGVERPVALPGRAEPDYPPAALRAKLEGLVVLRARISAQGDVESIEVVRESRPGFGFAAAAAAAVATWEYRPGRLDGRPVSVMLTVVVEFKLR